MKLAFSIFLMITVGCGETEKKEENTSTSWQELELRDENPEYIHQAKSRTLYGKDDTVIGKYEYSYTELGDVALVVYKVPDKESGELSHQTTSEYTYDDQNRLEIIKVYSDSEKSELKSKTKTTYIDGVISRTFKTDYLDGEKDHTYDQSYDTFGRELKYESISTFSLKSSAQLLDHAGEESYTCEYEDDSLFSKKTCTEVLDAVKTRVDVFDYPGLQRSVTNFVEGSEQGFESYTATVVEGFPTFDLDIVTDGLRKFPDEDTKETRIACTVKEEEMTVSCVETTFSDSQKVRELTLEYVLKPYIIQIGSYTNASVYRYWNTRRQDRTILGEETTKRVTTSRSYNGLMMPLQVETTTEVADESGELTTLTQDVTAYSYGDLEDQIVQRTTERKKGAGDPASSVVKVVYEYD